VSTVKAALRKYAEETAPRDWDLHLPWLLMGYRFSTQHSLGVVSPYEMLYGKRALLPLRGQAPSAVADPCRRIGTTRQPGLRPCGGELSSYQLMLPAAKEHLQAAQDRDRRRHSSRTHDSSGVPWQTHPYQEGDFVYLRRPPRNTLETDKAAPILRVHRLTSAGGVELRGVDGVLSITEHTRNVAPCSLRRVVPLPKYLQQLRGEPLQTGGSGEVGAASGSRPPWGGASFEPRCGPSTPSGQLGAEGHNGLQA